ncbi:MAG TPA: hypothetical protein VER11_11270 [Polyangiaceae bacterium]|nr:hypothetical protein [Polyangiaceae bacterium]
MNTLSKACLFAAALVLAACGTEVGRVGFSGEGSSSVTTPLKAGEVDFWTDLDIQFEGNAELHYQVALMQGGSRVATAVCDVLAPKSGKLLWIEIDRGPLHSRRGAGQMPCSATLPKSGPTTVEATLAFGVRPLRVTLRRADLVVKQ